MERFSVKNGRNYIVLFFLNTVITLIFVSLLCCICAIVMSIKSFHILQCNEVEYMLFCCPVITVKSKILCSYTHSSSVKGKVLPHELLHLITGSVQSYQHYVCVSVCELAQPYILLCWTEGGMASLRDHREAYIRMFSPTLQNGNNHWKKCEFFFTVPF